MSKKPTLVVSPDLLKAQVKAYTRKDGAFVQAHDDKRAAAAPHPNVVGKAENLQGGDASKAHGMHFAGKQYSASGKSGTSMHDQTPVRHFKEVTGSGNDDGQHVWMDHGGSVHADARSEAPRLRKEYEAHMASQKPAPAKFDGAAVAKKHDDKMERKASEWGHDGYEGKKIPASDVAGAPEFTHKEVYGHDRKTSPAGTDFSSEFAAKGHTHFVMKHPGGQRSFVNTEGGNYARYHAPVENAPAKKDDSAYSAPAEGEVGHEEHKQYGKYFRKGDKVKDGAGVHHEVLSHTGAGVTTTGGGTYHPTKLDFVSGGMQKSVLVVRPDLLKAHVEGFTRKDGTVVKPHERKIEAHGVKGMKSTPWRKTFKSQQHFEDFMDKSNGDHQVLGYRELDAPASEAPKMKAAHVDVQGEDRYEYANGKKPGGKGGSYIFSPHKSHDFGAHGNKAGEDYFQSQSGDGYSDAKKAAKAWGASKGHGTVHLQS